MGLWKTIIVIVILTVTVAAAIAGAATAVGTALVIPCEPACATSSLNAVKLLR